jgi:replicative DNA helicase
MVLSRTKIQKIILGLMCIDEDFRHSSLQRLDAGDFDEDFKYIFRSIYTLALEGEVVDFIELKKSGLTDNALNMVFQMVASCPTNVNGDWYINKLKEGIE